jgi:hypothetical protein
LDWKHALGVAAIAILSVAVYDWLFGTVAPNVPVLSWIASLIRGGQNA